MRALLPFSADCLPSVPAGVEVVVGDGFDEVPTGIADVEVYVPAYTLNAHRVAELVRSMPELRVIQTLTAGVDSFAGLVPPGVTLCNAAGVHDAATSELAVGLMIAAQRGLAGLVHQQDEHRWEQRMSESLADREVLVVGAGRIANALRRRLAGFECPVTLVGRSARDGVRAVAELPALLPAADIVVLLVPLTDATRGLVDRKFLAAMADGALLVNVARGPVVVTDDLLAELTGGRLRAALDVTDPEPLPPDHPLWDADGLLLTPHVGGAASSMWPRAYRLVADQLDRIDRGEPLLNVVDLDTLTRWST